MKKTICFCLLVMCAAAAAAQQSGYVEFDLPRINRWVLVNDGVNLRQGPSTTTPRLVYRILDDGCLDCDPSLVYATTTKRGDRPAHARYAPVIGEQNDWLNIYYSDGQSTDYYYSGMPWVSQKLTRPAVISNESNPSISEADFFYYNPLAIGKYRGLIVAAEYGYEDSQQIHLGCFVGDMIVLFKSIGADWNGEKELKLYKSWQDENGNDHYDLQIPESALNNFHLSHAAYSLEPVVELLLKNRQKLIDEMILLVPFKGSKKYTWFIFDDEFTGERDRVKYYYGDARASTESPEAWANREFAKLESICDMIKEAEAEGNSGSWLADPYTEAEGIGEALKRNISLLSPARQQRLKSLIKSISWE